MATASRLLSAGEASAIDAALMSSPGFTIDQLMELAGLAVAQAVYQQYKPSTHRSVLIIAGPGNNGGDGIVAARHLQVFGYQCSILHPKMPTKGDAERLFSNIVFQARASGVMFIDSLPSDLGNFSIVIDAIFGFSFSGVPRAPFDDILRTLIETNVASRVGTVLADGEAALRPLHIVSIDVPSGWDVDRGDTSAEGLRPSMLVSLTAPKKCAAFFKGHHWLGGRFVTPDIARTYGLESLMAMYQGSDQVVKLS